MRYYDVIAFGTGSAMNIVAEAISMNPDLRVAVVENGPVGGICLTRGCIPSKMLLYPAEIVHTSRQANRFWMDIQVKKIDFARIMEWAYEDVMGESRTIEENIRGDPRIDLYRSTGEFVDDYTVKSGDALISGDKILLCTGSRPLILPIPGLEEVGYITNENFFELRRLPRSVAIIGGGYIAMELGFFLAMMGSRVTVLEMLPRVVSTEEPEISHLLEYELGEFMDIRVNHRVVEARRKNGMKVLVAEDMKSRETVEVEADEIIVAAGRKSNSDITKPEKTGVRTDRDGWIMVDEYLETTKPNIWACGDAIGKYMFKHVANYESQIVFYNAFHGRKVKVDYSAVPHAIFVQPEVAAVGMGEEEARRGHDILVGYCPYKDTAKGLAMKSEHHFAKVIVEKDTFRILGAHAIGPYASSMIHEAVMLMYTRDGSAMPVFWGMHIHPAVNEVIERAFYDLREPEEWEGFKEHLAALVEERRRERRLKVQAR